MEKKWQLAGGFFALTLLSGEGFWWLLLPLGCAYLLQSVRKTDGAENSFSISVFATVEWRKFFISIIVTLVLAGTVGFAFPSQLGNTFLGLTSFLAGWQLMEYARTSFFWQLIPFYEFPVFLFGIIGIIWLMIKKHAYKNFLLAWFGITFLFFLFYPNKNVEIFFWVNLPLMISAALFLAEAIIIPAEEKNLTHKIVAGGLVISVFLIQMLINLLLQVQSTRIYILFGIGILLFAAVVFLVGYAYSWKRVGQSLLLVIIINCGIYSMAASWNAGMLREPYQNELWSISPPPLDYKIFMDMLEKQVKWKIGGNENVYIQVNGVKSASLDWALLPYHVVNEGNSSLRLQSPDVIISTIDQSINADSDYRGQDFIWSSQPPWLGMFSNEWLHWIFTRDAPQDEFSQTRFIAWVRSDIFSGSQIQSSQNQ